MVKIIILGSGATYGTLPRCPPTFGFGRALADVFAQDRRNWRDEYPDLAQVVADLWPEKRKPRLGELDRAGVDS